MDKNEIEKLAEEYAEKVIKKYNKGAVKDIITDFLAGSSCREGEIAELKEQLKKEQQDHYYTRCAWDSTTAKKEALIEEIKELKEKYEIVDLTLHHKGLLFPTNEQELAEFDKNFNDTYLEKNVKLEAENAKLKQAIRDNIEQAKQYTLNLTREAQDEIEKLLK